MTETRKDEQRDFAEALRRLDDASLRREFVEAGNVYEHFGGYWTLRLVREEMERRGL